MCRSSLLKSKMADGENDAKCCVPKQTYTALQTLQMTQKAIENEQNNGFLSEDSLDKDEEQDSETESLLLQATCAAADDTAEEHVESNVDNSVGSDLKLIALIANFNLKIVLLWQGGGSADEGGGGGGRETEVDEEVCH